MSDIARRGSASVGSSPRLADESGEWWSHPMQLRGGEAAAQKHMAQLQHNMWLTDANRRGVLDHTGGGLSRFWSFSRCRRQAGDDGIRHCQRIPVTSDLRLQVEGETDAEGMERFLQIDAHAARRRTGAA